MKFARGTREEMLQLRDEDSALHGYPMGPTRRRWDVIRRGSQYLYPIDNETINRREEYSSSARVFIQAAVFSTGEDEQCERDEVIE